MIFHSEIWIFRRKFIDCFGNMTFSNKVNHLLRKLKGSFKNTTFLWKLFTCFENIKFYIKNISIRPRSPQAPALGEPFAGKPGETRGQYIDRYLYIYICIYYKKRRRRPSSSSVVVVRPSFRRSTDLSHSTYGPTVGALNAESPKRTF